MANLYLPDGFRYAGIHCGIRKHADDRLDLALVVSDRPAAAAGVFTQNRIVAAPVQVSRDLLPSAQARGIIICSGNANACTGEQGRKDARRMMALAAEHIGCRAEQMLVCSTGVIGVPLPMKAVESGIGSAASALSASPEAFEYAARAILTTDTHTKISTRQLSIGERTIHLAGFAKGAAMIGPNMATMLAFVLSDAPVAVDHLQSLIRQAADETFNCISVEGHTSTNDTLLIMTNGSGEPLADEALRQFDDAVVAICADLARAIAADAEGASHLVRIEVKGLRNNDEARRVAKTVAESALVKTAIFGGDPNWGRIVSAAGYAGVEFEEHNLSLWLGETLLYEHGTPKEFDAAAVSRYLKENRNVEMRLVFTLGDGRAAFWTSDLTYEYVRLNAEYTT